MRTPIMSTNKERGIVVAIQVNTNVATSTKAWIYVDDAILFTLATNQRKRVHVVAIKSHRIDSNKNAT